MTEYFGQMKEGNREPGIPGLVSSTGNETVSSLSQERKGGIYKTKGKKEHKLLGNDDKLKIIMMNNNDNLFAGP